VLGVLHSAGVNVASLNSTRPTQTAGSDGLALTFMALDDDLPTNAMTAIKSLSKIKSVSKINLK
jgi:hypothetical protein